MFSNKDHIASLTVRWLHLVWQGGLFSILYYANLHYAANQEVVPSITTVWDEKLPSIRWMILPYASSFMFFLIAFLRSQSRISLLKLSQQIALATLIASAIFFFMPLSYGEFEDAGADIWSPLYALLHQVDRPYNQFPSLHVTYAIIFLVALWPRQVLFKVLLVIACSLLISSTLFTQQHHLVDVISGAILAVLIIVNGRRLPLNPPAFFYFTNTMVVLLLAGIYPQWLPLFGYLAISFGLLSYSYSSNQFDQRLLGKQGNGRFTQIQRLLLFPYFFVYWLLWYLQTLNGSKAFISINSTLFCGRRLTKLERQQLPENCRCMDLGCELRGHSEQWLDYQSMPLLDLVPIHSQAMLPICRQLHKWQQQYPDDSIYIHCTMGISRSLATVLCYSSFKGENVEQVRQHIQHKRPEAHLPAHYLSQQTLKNIQELTDD